MNPQFSIWGQTCDQISFNFHRIFYKEKLKTKDKLPKNIKNFHNGEKELHKEQSDKILRKYSVELRKWFKV